MRRFYLLCWSLVWCGVLTARLPAGEYHLSNGDIIRGEPASITEDGVVFKLDIGGFSPQRRWTKFTQETLKELAKDPRATKFAEPFIDLPPDARPEPVKKKEITVRSVESRLPRHERIPFLDAWSTPMAMALLFVLYVANLYAAVEIARFRNRSAALVCGVSAVLPVLGPLVFLSLPTLDEHGMEIHPEGAGSETPVPLPANPLVSGSAGAASAGAGLGLAKAAKEESSSTTMSPGMFKRGDYTFNRRFIETKFSGFFRLVPIEAEKDLVLVVRTNKNEFLAKRVTRISSNDLHLQLMRGGIEQAVPFADITEFQIRHKDAKA